MIWIVSGAGCSTKKHSAPATPHTATHADATDATATTTAREAAPLTSLPASVMRGVCLAHNWQDRGARGYGSDASQQTIAHLKEMGVEWISVTPFGWMASLDSPVIGGEYSNRMPEGGESSDRLKAIAKQAREAGLKVMIKPHLWVQHGAWRGDIAPVDVDGNPDWTSWWLAYQEFILFYAELAQEIEADAFVVGVELVSALKHDPRAMIETIGQVREAYDGPLTYSANWDESVSDAIWRALDAIGVQLYPPLSEDPDPSVPSLRDALGAHMDTWTVQAERLDKPVWLTEIGYKSAPTAVSEPFGWPERLDASLQREDERLQARAYHALFAEIHDHPRIQGVFVWKYFTDAHTDEEGRFGFSPRDKIAERALRQAFSRP